MTATTTTRPPARTPFSSHSHLPRTSHRTSSTPSGLPARTPASVGQPNPPALTPSSQRAPQTPSPNYFGLVVEPGRSNPADSNAGEHVRRNWSPPTSKIRSAATDQKKNVPLAENPDFEAFRRQSEHSQSFNLGHGNLSRFSLGHGTAPLPTLGTLADDRSKKASLLSPKAHVTTHNDLRAAQNAKNVSFEPMDIDEPRGDGKVVASPATGGAPSLFDSARTDSPASLTTASRPPSTQDSLSHVSMDGRAPRLSLPGSRLDTSSSQTGQAQSARSESLPYPLKSENAMMVTPGEVNSLITNNSADDVLILDLRVAPQYASSRVRGALNLCIPTTLLKRPMYNVSKLADTFADRGEKSKFLSWEHARYIIVYDANSTHPKDAISCQNVLKKFTSEGWKGTPMVVKGGFSEVSKKCAELVDKQQGSDHAGAGGFMPVVGGCPMPTAQTAANPFFNNIRQNMDLIGGVGQIGIKQPENLSDKAKPYLPAWLHDAVDESDKGKRVADKFLKIEKEEQSRMQQALSGNVTYGSPSASGRGQVSIAGMEQGTKNRYKDMLPFDHSRVRLQSYAAGGSDYVNASHVKAEWSQRRYIASQAPVPDSFEDFWRVVWEQDCRVIVMLTAESEGPQRKSHPYWLPGTYGAFKIKGLSEKKVALEKSSNKLAPTKHAGSVTTPSPVERPSMNRRSTNPLGSSTQSSKSSSSQASAPGETPYSTIRKLTLSHTQRPFEPLREITQIQFAHWPDFGAPAHPKDILGLVDQTASIYRASSGLAAADENLPAQEGCRPILVHCSAGCGRTGAFCTIDSVIDMLKRQRATSLATKDPSSEAAMRLAENTLIKLENEKWVEKDDTDLIAKTVEDFRHQRLSLVQNLRQFTLCYESVLEWMAREITEMPEVKREGARRSYQG